MRLWNLAELPRLPPLELAVVGHVEWLTVVAVEQMPQPGHVRHALQALEEAGGAGAVVAVTLSRLLQRPVMFFTALGRDAVGEQAAARLQALGVDLQVIWREQPTRRAVSLVDGQGERAITVIGERLAPSADDPLPWSRLAVADGIFATAADADTLRLCRSARVLAATPRLRLPVLQAAAVRLDALIGSGLDPSEQMPQQSIRPVPALQIATAGAAGGEAFPGGRFPAPALPGPVVDSYGCGDSFAAGVTAALAAGWSVEQAISLGCHCGAACALHLGPYPGAPP